MKLFYTSSVVQQLTQSRSLHLQTPHQGGKLVSARPLYFLLPYHPSLIFLPQTKLTYYTCQSSSICPYIPCSQHCCLLFPPGDYYSYCCVIACKPSLISTHTHTKCFFSLSSNIHFRWPTFMLVPLLSVCDIDTHMLHSSPSNYLSHAMRFLDTYTVAFKVQQRSPKKLRVLSHTLRRGGGSIFTCVK